MKPDSIKTTPWLALAGLLLLALPLPAVRADEEAIRESIHEFFQTDDTSARLEIVERIESDPAYDRSKVGEWLHEAGLFEPLSSGQTRRRVSLADGSSRTVVLRIPADYDPAWPYPLIYALHGQGGNAGQIIRYVERLLGEQNAGSVGVPPAIEQFVIAAPDRYEDVVIHHSRWPPTGEHPAALRTVRRTAHIDSDRVYVLGYSRGGHAAWTLGVLHADQFAGVVPLAGTFVLEQIDALWPIFLPNLANTHVLAVWGQEDTRTDSGEQSREGGIAGLNRRLREACNEMDLPVTAIELEGIGHGGVVPPGDELQRILSYRREPYPRKFEHAFRHLVQASAYWIEAHEWAGPQWGDKLPAIELGAGERASDPADVRKAAFRKYNRLIGELHGRIDGQLVDTYRKHVRELTVWFGEGMIDWNEPVTIEANGRIIFEGRIEPDLYVCLSQAARTYDLDRLRWAGIRYRSGHRARPVDAKTEFPNPLP